MAQQHINSGVTANDGTGDTLRAAMLKIEANFNELYSMISATTPNWHQAYEIYSGSAITVPSGFNGSVRNMDNPQAEVVFTVAGTSLTITSGADTGDNLNIFGIY